MSPKAGLTLRTLNYGNYGIFLVMGNAGFFISSTVSFLVLRLLFIFIRILISITVLFPLPIFSQLVLLFALKGSLRQFRALGVQGFRFASWLWGVGFGL